MLMILAVQQSFLMLRLVHAVFIAYLSGKSFALNKQKADKAGRILILGITLYADQYILINLYNADTDIKEVQILEEL